MMGDNNIKLLSFGEEVLLPFIGQEQICDLQRLIEFIQ
jgi:hypothetical protein